MKSRRFALSVMMLLVLILGVVHAGSYLQSSTFETGDLSEWETTNGTPDVGTSYKHLGSYGMKCDSDSAGAGDYVYSDDASWGNYSSYYCEFYFQLKHDLSGFDVLTILTFKQSGSGAIQILLESDSGNKLRCYTEGGTSVVWAIVKDAWYHVEIDSTVGGETTFTLNDDPQTIPSTSLVWNEVSWGCRWRGTDSGVDVDIWFDDFYFKSEKSLGEAIDAMLENIVPVMGSSGLIMLMFCPFFIVRRAKNKDVAGTVAYSMIIATVGFGLVVVWLWG